MTERYDGLIVLDKPGSITSRTAVDRAMRWFPRGTRMGHTGTLDPLATGVLVLCLGNATRLTEYVQAMYKTYRAQVCLGARSDTDDADGTVTPSPETVAPSQEAITQVLASFVGTIAQIPPAFSAAKVTGSRAYDLARRGAQVTLEPRSVNVYRIDMLSYTWPYLELEVNCGKGTYIRALARDLGEQLGCGGFIQSLRRTQVGPFRAEHAVTLESEPSRVRESLLPLDLAVVDLPRVELSTSHGQQLCQGQTVPLPQAVHAGVVAVYSGSPPRFLAVASCDVTHHRLRPLKVLGPQSK
jgi:tRNA pseudouridine55 synthase